MTLTALIDYLKQHADKGEMSVYAGVLGKQARPVYGIQVSRLYDDSYQCVLVLQNKVAEGTPCQPGQ